MLQSAAQEMMDRIGGWARARPDVIGVLLVGSYARSQATPDSDLDLVVLVDDPAACLADSAWVEAFGKVERWSMEDWGRVRSLRAHYVGGIEVEFGLTDASWLQPPLDTGTRRVLDDGFVILHDHQGAVRGALRDSGYAESIRSAPDRTSE